ncbi:MAG: beta strand repeat-containing protein, partial [Isosphaeraceae bacterium]
GVNTAVTDINGVVTSTVFTANATTGTYLVTASASGYASASIQATNQNALKPLVIYQGNGQTATVNTAFAQTIQIRTLDLNNNPVPGVTVTFAVPASGATGTFAGGVTSAVTDSNGVATAPVLTASTSSGAFVVTASVSGSLPVSVNLTINPGAAASVTAVSGGSQAATVETAFANSFKARVRDTYGNVVPGVSVTFAAPVSGASLRYAGGSAVAVSGADGIATSAAMTANNVSGNYTVTASATGASSAAFSMTNSSATAASLALFSGSSQSATVATAFGAALKVRATDSFGNPVAGVTVTFALPATGASASLTGGVLTGVTGSDGVATSAGVTANTVAGNYTVTASASGLGSVNFSLTNTAGAAAAMNVVGGTGQSAKVGVDYANPLKISVVDAYGNAVAGKTVTFTAPASGASATFAGGANTAVSGADGVATSAVLTAISLAGAYSVTASSTGLANKTFSLTNTVFSVTSFEVVDGSILRVWFNDTIATSGLQINDIYTGNTLTEEADMVVTDSTGAAVKGSMIVAADLKSVQFVKSGVNFSAGTYGVKLRSDASAFRASDGTLLDGNGDGTPGGNYLNSFTVSATTKTLTIPDVVRGPGQDLRVNPTDNGIPVKISDGVDIYSFEMSINYDPALITVTELVVPASLTASLDLTYNVTVPGRIDIVGVAPAGLPSGAQNLFFVRGSVPSGALYRTKCTLDVSNL